MHTRRNGPPPRLRTGAENVGHYGLHKNYRSCSLFFQRTPGEIHFRVGSDTAQATDWAQERLAGLTQSSQTPESAGLLRFTQAVPPARSKLLAGSGPMSGPPSVYCARLGRNCAMANGSSASSIRRPAGPRTGGLVDWIVDVGNGDDRRHGVAGRHRPVRAAHVFLAAVPSAAQGDAAAELLSDRRAQPAGRGPDRDVHRHGLGGAELRAVSPGRAGNAAGRRHQSDRWSANWGRCWRPRCWPAASAAPWRPNWARCASPSRSTPWPAWEPIRSIISSCPGSWPA